jgi:ribose transport system ATP-binding protein
MTDTPENSVPILEITDVTKRFSGVTALNQVNLSIRKGELHAVIGENGAGKSTLMKILAGVQPPDSGTIKLDGKPITLTSVQKALDLGIALIHQELNLAENLDVAANIFLGREPTKLGMIDSKTIRKESEQFLKMVGLNIEPTVKVRELTIGLQQLVEIAKALSVNARVLIMDEPTSSLSQRETESLFKVIANLKEQGVTIIYISHRLNEITKLADRVTVLRDSENAGGLERHEINHDAMVNLMVGRDISQFYARKQKKVHEAVLELESVRTTTWPTHSVSFKIHGGEIVGIGGLVGAGRTELLETVFGLQAAVSGTIKVDGKALQLKSNRDAINAGIALVPEDRKGAGLVLQMGVRNNIGLAGLWRHKIAAGFLNRKKEKSDSDLMVEELKIKTPTDAQWVQYLSGGNQQKVVIGKWLSMTPRVLLLDEPTRGVDIGAKQEIYRLMEEQADQGVAVLFVSSEMEEVISMSDRVLVMHEGRLAGELSRNELCEESIMQLATGGGLADVKP